MDNQPKLSIVATSRNDNHGGDLLQRMQCFVDALLMQCNRYNLPAELILVEWNPPINREPLAKALRFPEKKGECDVRIVTVPKEIHDQFKYAQELPLYQMIAKNVGVRRSQGKYILATNIDIIFNDKLMKYLKKKLMPGIIYRVDRYDVPPAILTIEDQKYFLNFCENNAFRWHRKNGTFLQINNRWQNPIKLNKKKSNIKYFSIKTRIKERIALFRQNFFNFTQSKNVFEIIFFLLKKLFFKLPRIILIHIRNFFYRLTRRIMNYNKKLFKLTKKTIKYLFFRSPIQNIESCFQRITDFKKHLKEKKNLPHTNACGDFTLASRDVWEKLRGYPEWDIFSWHIDSVLMHQAYISGIKEIDLPHKMSIYHIEHNTGSGYTPEAADKLFTRLKEKNIRFLSNEDFDEIVIKMKQIKEEEKEVYFNPENWGLQNLSLPEKSIYL